MSISESVLESCTLELPIRFRRSLDLVKIYLEALSEQVYNSLHPEPNDEND